MNGNDTAFLKRYIAPGKSKSPGNHLDTKDWETLFVLLRDWGMFGNGYLFLYTP
jgi:hypothetical protein